MNHTPGGVTIVRVGGTTIGGGGRNDGVAASRSEVNIGGGPHRDGGGLFQPNTTAGIVSKFGNKYQKHNDTSRSTSRLVTATNRSMPRLNAREFLREYKFSPNICLLNVNQNYSKLNGLSHNKFLFCIVI